MDFNEGATGRAAARRRGAVRGGRSRAAPITWSRFRCDSVRICRPLGARRSAGLASLRWRAYAFAHRRTAAAHRSRTTILSIDRGNAAARTRCSGNLTSSLSSFSRASTACATTMSAIPTSCLMGDSHANMSSGRDAMHIPARSTLQIGAATCPYLRDTEFRTDNWVSRRGLCPPLTESAYRAITPGTSSDHPGRAHAMYTVYARRIADPRLRVAKHFRSRIFPVPRRWNYRTGLARDLQ